MKIEFRQIQKRDFKLMLAVFNYYIENSNALWFTEPIPMGELMKLFPFRNRKYKTYKIMSERAMCGFCCFKQYNKRQGYDRTAEISIYFKPEFSGKGWGLKTLRFLEKQARRAGIKVLLASISGDNTASLRLFRKAGYFKSGQLRQIGEKSGKILDAVFYQKIIAS